MALLTIIGSNVFGRLLDDDYDNMLYNFGYSESLALIPERLTQVWPSAILDLIKNATAAQSYIDDINSVLTIPMDLYKTAQWGYGWATQDPEFVKNQDNVIKTGSYQGFTNWQRDLLKATSILLPGLGLNNIAKNARSEGHHAYQNWQLQQSPTDFLKTIHAVYKPQKSKSKSANKQKGEIKVLR